MSKPIRVIQYGLGAIGRAAARFALTKDGLELIGAVDRDPQFAGRDLGTVLGLDRPLGISVSPTLAAVLTRGAADAVIHCTCSTFREASAQFTEIVNAGLHCVTSCEEAMFPEYRSRSLAAELDRLCVAKKVAVVGTGVNPGFVMDTLALVLTGVCQKVEAIRVRRVVDAASRREALQRKVGATLTAAQFDGLVRDGKMGHVGLAESLMFLADALGWPVDRVAEQVEAVLAGEDRPTAFLVVKQGAVAGVHQFARGFVGPREVLTLELQMYVGAERPRDEIEIVGNPPLRLVIEPGTPGDIATPAILINVVPRLRDARPGLHTMRTLGLVHAGN